MKSPALLDPLNIITSCTLVKEVYHLDQFRMVMNKLYCYEIFKPMLDLVATKAMQGSLKFKVQDQKLFDLDEGNCRTIEGGAVNKFLNRIKVENKYVITIKKISADVIVHEISHMIEKEIEGAAVAGFADQVLYDLRTGNGNVSLLAAAKQVMGVEVEAYPPQQRNSELFARYFQLLAMSKEVAGYNSNYGYSIVDVYKLFIATEKWLISNLYRSILPKINEAIAKQSLEYIKELGEIKHSWADEKVKSVHYKTAGAPKWSKALKSIKDDPFQ